MFLISKIGIIGEGKMGSGIFNYLLDYPFELTWVCSPQADTDKLTRQFAKRINRSLDAGIIDQQRFDSLKQTTLTRSLDDLKRCNLIIEAVPEIPQLKRELFAGLDKIVDPAAIFTSNSSSINPSRLAIAGNSRRQLAGLHFFYPVALKNIVEFTVTEEITEETRMVVETFLKTIQRRFITLDEKNSFMLNKIFLDLQNEAFLLVHAGHCSYVQMDQLVKTHLFPFGIFDFCDSVGLDTMLWSVMNYTAQYPHESYYSQFINALSELVSQGRLGMKTQRGFHDYPMESEVVPPPVNALEIVNHLRQAYLSSAKRFTALAHIPMDDANHAIKEYFNLDKGPFE